MNAKNKDTFLFRNLFLSVKLLGVVYVCVWHDYAFHYFTIIIIFFAKL